MAGVGEIHLRRDETPVLSVRNLVVQHRLRRRSFVEAVSGVSFDVLHGETLALVGESGSGKSSTARAVIQLPPPTGGEVALFGRELQGVSPEELRQLRRKLQIIVQDPVGALNPLKRVRQLAAEGLEVWSDRDPEKVDAMLTAVGLDPEIYAARRRRELSGGQCQRLCIARALLIGPEMLICDEPVSALDVSIQAQIVELLRELQGSMGLSMLFISHDLRIVKSIASRVLVLYMGRVCEVGDADALYSSPTHPYTKLLIEAVEGGAIEADPGEIPSALEPPSGCRFRTRCPAADARCVAEVPQLRQVGDDHFVACHHFPDEAR